jgi:hypothetical protein
MNVRRGLLGVWISISVVWTAAIIINMVEIYVRLSPVFPDLDWSYWFVNNNLFMTFIPWLLTAAVLTTRWAIKGFRSIRRL